MSTAPELRLHVSWPACSARGLCHELLPDLVELDEWGYPLLTGELTPERVAEARRAVKACPTLALKLRPR